MPGGVPNDDRIPLLLLLALGALLYFPKLGGIDLWNPDEPRYAQVAREMVETGKWAVPHLNGKVYDQKPPGFFWLVGGLGLANAAVDRWASPRMDGGAQPGTGPGPDLSPAPPNAAGRGAPVVDEWAARLPSAVAATLTLLLTCIFGARLFGRRAGLVAGIVLATSLLFAVMARKGNIDAVLTLQVLLSIFWLEEGVRWPERRAYTWLGAFLLMGFGGLLKGVGLVLPLLVLVVYLLLRRSPRTLLDWRLALGMLLAAAVLALWAAAATRQEGWTYVVDLVQRQVLKRYVDPSSHVRPFWYYFATFPVDFWPWTAFLPSLALFLWRTGFERRFPRFTDRVAGDHTASEVVAKYSERRTSWLLVAAWLGVHFVFFSCSASKRDLYLLPAFPAAAMAVGALIAWAVDRAEPGPTLVNAPFLFVCWLHGLVSVLVVTTAAIAHKLVERHDFLAAVKPYLPAFRWPALALAVLFGLCNLAAALLWRSGRRLAGLGAFVGAALVVTLGASCWVLPALNPYKSVRSACEEIQKRHPRPGRVVYLGSLDEAYLYYLDRPIEEVRIKGKAREGDANEEMPEASVRRIQELLDAPERTYFLMAGKDQDGVCKAVQRTFHKVPIPGSAAVWRKAEVWSNRAP